MRYAIQAAAAAAAAAAYARERYAFLLMPLFRQSAMLLLPRFAMPLLMLITCRYASASASPCAACRHDASAADDAACRHATLLPCRQFMLRWHAMPCHIDASSVFHVA